MSENVPTGTRLGVEETRPAEGQETLLQVWVEAPDAWLNSNDRRHRHAQAKLVKTWRKAGTDAVAGMAPITERVHMTATIHKARDGRWDPNNLWPTVKAIVDGIVDAGVLADDDHKHLIGPDMRRGAKGVPRIVLEMHYLSSNCEIIEVAPEVLKHHPRPDPLA